VLNMSHLIAAWSGRRACADVHDQTTFPPLFSVSAAETVKSAEPQLGSLSRSQLQDVLRYHIVPAALPIPAGLQADKPYPTAFKGHNLKFKYNQWVPGCQHSCPDSLTELSSLQGHCTGAGMLIKHAVLRRKQAAWLNSSLSVVLCCACRVAPKAGNASHNKTGPHASQRQLGQTVEIVPEAGTFGGKQVAGVTVPKVTLANLFANRVSVRQLEAQLGVCTASAVLCMRTDLLATRALGC
jgi:hypothetical protein